MISTSRFWVFADLAHARFDPEQDSLERFEYELLDIYDGLPTYKWNAHATTDMETFENNANRYNDYLFDTLRYALTEKLQPYHGEINHSRRERYWTQRVRRLVAGNNISFVQARWFALPLVIPMALQTCIEETRYRYDEFPDSTLSNVLVPVHDPSRYRPTTVRIPSLQDTWDESGNLRYWLISNETMWSGQHRALDEIKELLLMLFSWFARKQAIGQHVYSTDHPQCLW